MMRLEQLLEKVHFRMLERSKTGCQAVLEDMGVLRRMLTTFTLGFFYRKNGSPVLDESSPLVVAMSERDNMR